MFTPIIKKALQNFHLQGFLFSGDPAGIRTQDHYIKSVMLYQLSYGIIFSNNFWNSFDTVSLIAGAKVWISAFVAKYNGKILFLFFS